LYATSFLNNKAMATSGNYRNYHMIRKQMVAHTINPKTGYSEIHNLLSATVFADKCTMADAYATACMVQGVERSIEMIDELEGVDAFLIYTNDQGEFEFYASSGIKNQVEVLD
jgi:thiamine biosynthesis lipoprotein